MLIPKVERRIEQCIAYLERHAYRTLGELEFEAFETSRTFRLPPDEAAVEGEGGWRRIGAGGPWGSEWRCTWFRTRYTAPEDGLPLFVEVVPNADSLVFLDRRPYGAVNGFHRKLRLPADGKAHTLYVESYAGHFHDGCGPFDGKSVVVTIGKVLSSFPNTFDGGRLLQRLEGVYGLLYDVKALFETARILDEDSLRRARLLSGLSQALTPMGLTLEGEALEAAAKAARAALAPLLALKNSATTPVIAIVGHAHIDHAWLWPIAETERKTARTFANMARFAEEYPEFVFVQSQPCQMEIVKREYPAVFEDVKEAFKRGAWDPNGGMWVEADCNLPSGESFIRQFLVGKAANRALFGEDYEADTLWLPDVFGYSAALPQVLAGCGIRYFVTSKIGWNDTTRFPYETFFWRGIDGTAIGTHYISRSQGYNGRVTPKALLDCWKDVQHKELQSVCVQSIGEGDGGGGTLRSDLEYARRLGDLEGAPRLAWTKPSDALAALFSGEAAKSLPEWRGELYLELHRGTYTTQARTKRNNRKLEYALRRAEFLFAAASLAGAALEYPRESFTAFWKRVLTFQFHDIIPGSSIRRVYEEAEAESAKMLAALERMANTACAHILASAAAGGARASVLLVNDLAWERAGAAVVPADSLEGASALAAADGTLLPAQTYTDMDGTEQAVFWPTLPSLGWRSFVPCAAGPSGGAENPFQYSEFRLSTPYYEVTFDREGRIVGLVDKAADNGVGRNLVAPGGAFNGFVLAEDIPVYWDAWDIDADWERHIIPDSVKLFSTQVVSSGPLFFRLRREYRVGTASTLTQDTVFYSRSRRLDFETKVDWRERSRLFKVQFDTALDSREARCEIQWGHLFRATHKNLPQDRARFEICAHKWLTLEEPDYGVALLNDCKYGHDAASTPEGSRLRLSLLRSPHAPDPEADQGEQRFTYALLPFAGAFRPSTVVREANELNCPVTSFAGSGGGEASFSLASVEGCDSVVLETVKETEEAGALVLRLYESAGIHCKAAVRLAFTPGNALLTDMLERGGRKVPLSDGVIALDFHPFEIKTLVIEPVQKRY